MRKRLFVLTNSKIPFGNANSNYIRMFSKAVLEAGWQVIVLGCGDNNPKDKQPDGKYMFEGIEYNNMKFNEHMIPFSISGYLWFGNAMVKHMKAYNINERDYIYIYSAYWNLFDRVKKEYQNIHINGHLVADCVEWFQPWQYRFGFVNPEYQLWKYNFRHCITKYKKVIPISRHLENYFQSFGCSTVVVPPLVDSSVYENEQVQTGKNEYQFMYSGAATNKDSIDVIIEALALLSESDRKRVKFHFTTLSQDSLKGLLRDGSNAFDIVKDSLIFHGWLEYSELLDLYKKMDFLVLFREENTVTISNFPSKVPEMMNYGIIPVCSDVGDYTGMYLNDGIDSIFVKKCNANSGAEAFKRAIRVSAKEVIEMKKMAKKCATERFDYKVWSKTIVDFLES
ncbi:hypothetical protein DSECCO2_410910 [anaerobic digester metagenome]